MKFRLSRALGSIPASLWTEIKRSLSPGIQVGTFPSDATGELRRAPCHSPRHNAVNSIRKALVRDEMSAGSKHRLHVVKTNRLERAAICSANVKKKS